MSVEIYHNPRCSKSRQTLQLLADNNIEVEIVEYLKDVPSVAQLQELLTKLSMSVRELMRNKEAIYKELGLKDSNLTDNQLLEAMVANPKLIERPIVVNGDKAKIGRPPEQVLELFS